ncbi:MAG: lasso peptide biosynthesis B2 protein [Rhodothermales bacterium]|nr:lasso peptide biosynthesis B2 protein [Rhodothermales bacterium]
MADGPIHRLRALSWRDRLLLARVGLLLGGAWTALRIFPFRRVRDFCAGPAAPPSDRPRTARVDRLIWAVNAVGNRLFGDRPCLPKALGAQVLLRREGFPTTLRIGVTRGRGDDRFLAHAWLERDGDVWVGGADSATTYVPLDTRRAAGHPERPLG